MLKNGKSKWCWQSGGNNVLASSTSPYHPDHHIISPHTISPHIIHITPYHITGTEDQNITFNICRKLASSKRKLASIPFLWDSYVIPMTNRREEEEGRKGVGGWRWTFMRFNLNLCWWWDLLPLLHVGPLHSCELILHLNLWSCCNFLTHFYMYLVLVHISSFTFLFCCLLMSSVYCIEEWWRLRVLHAKAWADETVGYLATIMYKSSLCCSSNSRHGSWNSKHSGDEFGGGGCITAFICFLHRRM